MAGWWTLSSILLPFFNSMSLSRKKLREIWNVLCACSYMGCVCICMYIYYYNEDFAIYIFTNIGLYIGNFFLKKKTKQKKNIPYKILSLKEKRLYLFSHVFSSRFIPPYPVLLNLQQIRIYIIDFILF